MNERKHSPHPWKINYDLDFLEVLDFQGHVVIRYRFQDEENFANANFIAVAPEMFYELQDIVDMANVSPNGAANVFLSAADMQSIQRILNKAKGKC